eukprot:jgi/Astpho2/956/Aster-x0960
MPAAGNHSASPVALRWPPDECTEAAGGTLHTYTLPPLTSSRTGSARAAGASNPSNQAVSGSRLAQVPARACSLQLTVSFRKAFLSVFEHPPDAHRGFDIPAALVALPSQQQASCTATDAC